MRLNKHTVAKNFEKHRKMGRGRIRSGARSSNGREQTASTAIVNDKDPSIQLDSPLINFESNKIINVYPNYLQTDAGNAELFARVFGIKLRYNHMRSRWFIWRGHWWSEDQNDLVLQAAKNIARYRLQQSTTIDNEDAAKAEASWALRSESRSRLEAMLKLAQSEPPLSDDGRGWDPNPWLLGARNGVIDLRTGQLSSGRQSDKITMHTDVAVDSHARAPRWEQFVSEIFGGDLELIDYVQRAIGYCLTGDVSEQVIFLAHGSGANGKSTFLEVLRYVFGGYAYNLPFSAFELKSRSAIPNEIAALSGKRFVTAIETNESVELNEARIKALTGSDPITARFLYREFFTFVPTGKFWLAFNHKPKVSDDSPGFWRRIRLIPFLEKFVGKNADPDLIDTLKGEASGILNWAVQGSLKWQRDGFMTPVSVTEASEKYRHESDPLKEFLEDGCVVTSDAQVKAADLWKEYRSWAESNGETPLTRRIFAQKLESRGFIKLRVGHDRVWTWVGLRLRRNSPTLDPFIMGDLRADADVRIDIVPTSGQLSD